MLARRALSTCKSCDSFQKLLVKLDAVQLARSPGHTASHTKKRRKEERKKKKKKRRANGEPKTEKKKKKQGLEGLNDGAAHRLRDRWGRRFGQQ